MRFAMVLLATAAFPAHGASPLRFEISWAKPMDGHIVLILANRAGLEPRFQVSESLSTQQIFGTDVDGAGAAVIDASSIGYPRASLDGVPTGDYFVQAVLNVYETFHRGGHTLKLPMDQGEGQHWNRKPGNLYSEPMRVRVDPASSAPIRIALTKMIPPLVKPPDTKYVRHVKIQSKLLTEFWGRPMFVGAIVVMPQGFEDHPEAH